MEIYERTVNDITVLDLIGNLSLEGNTQFRNKISTLINAGAHNLIINMAQVAYMDSSGLGELVACYRAMKSLCGRMTLVELNQRLMHLLAITKLDVLFEIFPSDSAAIASFSRKTESEAPANASIARLP